MAWNGLRSRREILATLVAAGLAVWQNARAKPSALAARRTPVPDVPPPSPTPSAPGIEVSEPAEGGYDVVIAGGRVMDPETNFDRVANVGIKAGAIATVTTKTLVGTKKIDARGLVVAPGFIDNLSYEPNTYGVWFKIADGVTTTLGMHGFDGAATPLLETKTRYPVHFGGAFDDPWWRSSMGIGAYKAPSPAQVAALTAKAETQLRAGWIGIDVEPEYIPGTSRAEIMSLAKLAARHDMPVCFHARYSDDVAPGTNIDAIREVLQIGEESGAAVHVQHINSTGGAYTMEESLAMIAEARKGGQDVTACIYPYNFWSTFLASARFDRGWQDRFHITYSDLEMPETGERLTKSSFDRYRSQNKIVIAHAIPEKDVVTALKSPFVMMGSDTILVKGSGRHPRGAGTFARVLGRYVREQQALSLIDALAKMTIMPAKRVEKGAPAMRKKGRLQKDADADITVFDPRTVIDRATVRSPRRYSEGILYVLVGGKIVRDRSGSHEDVLPGRPVYSALALDAKG